MSGMRFAIPTMDLYKLNNSRWLKMSGDYQFHIDKRSLPPSEITSIAGNACYGHLHDWTERLPHHTISANQPTFIPQILGYIASRNIVIVGFVVACRYRTYMLWTVPSSSLSSPSMRFWSKSSSGDLDWDGKLTGLCDVLLDLGVGAQGLGLISLCVPEEEQCVGDWLRLLRGGRWMPSWWPCIRWA